MRKWLRRLACVLGTSAVLVLMFCAWLACILTVCRVKKAPRRCGGIPVYALSAPAGMPGADLSDHRNFWARDWPAVMVTDTAFLRNPRHHTVDDALQTLDYDRMARIVDGLREVARKFGR